MKTPLVLLTGFLGSGKTTLIRKLIPQLTARDVQTHLIINDYGNAIFDAETLRGSAASVADVTGGCVCCESIDVLLETLQTLKPKGRAVIIIEANGTTDVPSLLEVLTGGKSTRHCTPPMQVAVVDANNWQHREWNNTLEQEQVATASRVQFSWLDACDDERAKQVRDEVKALNPRCKEVSVETLAEELAMLARLSFLSQESRLEAPKFDLLKQAPHEHHHDTQRYHFSAMEVPLPPEVERRALLRCLETLPDCVLRAKGLVCLDDDPDGIFLAQKASPTAAPSLLRMSRTKAPQSMLVLVGASMDEAELRQHVRNSLLEDTSHAH